MRTTNSRSRFCDSHPLAVAPAAARSRRDAAGQPCRGLRDLVRARACRADEQLTAALGQRPLGVADVGAGPLWALHRDGRPGERSTAGPPASASRPAASGLATIAGTLATTSASSSPSPSATVWLIPKIIVIGSRRAYMPVLNASKLAISPIE